MEFRTSIFRDVVSPAGATYCPVSCPTSVSESCRFVCAAARGVLTASNSMKGIRILHRRFTVKIPDSLAATPSIYVSDPFFVNFEAALVNE